MGVEQHLERLRAVTAGCSLAAFGDLRTRLVLRVSADGDWPQERLDTLCVEAAESFRTADGIALRDAGLSDPENKVREAVILGVQEIRVYVRSDIDPNDMICCVCQSAQDVPKLTAASPAVCPAPDSRLTGVASTDP